MAEAYPDLTPTLTEREKELLAQYLANRLRAKAILHRLGRIERPLRATMALFPVPEAGTAHVRGHLFQQMLVQDAPFWAWPRHTWREFVATFRAPQSNRGAYPKVLVLAYLWGEVLVSVGKFSPRLIAEAVFTPAAIDAAMACLLTPLAGQAGAGYADTPGVRKELRHVLCLVLLANRHPDLTTITPQAILSARALLTWPANIYALNRLQTALCQLGILDEPAFLPARQARPRLSVLDRDTSDVDPEWVAWVRAFVAQTAGLTEMARKEFASFLLITGRWLKRFHPTVTAPQHWDEALATAYVVYTCGASGSELVSAFQRQRHAHCGDLARPLRAAGIANRLSVMRRFFLRLQRQSYVVNGRTYPRLEITWRPEEAFKTPAPIKAALTPNPRNIDQDAWYRLVWQAMTLTRDDIRAVFPCSQVPLAYYRAVALIWVTAGRRSDEIRRLSVGCVSREWVPEMTAEDGQRIEPAEQLCYLRVPTNKLTGEFTVPIPVYVADAIAAWERVRPANQEPRLDRKTRKPTPYLFMNRNSMMSAEFINRSVIPVLCAASGVAREDAVGRITSHRNRASTATWLLEMGMSPSDIGRILGHTHPLRTLPWYMRESKHRLARAYRKANPLDYMATAVLDTEALKRREPCIFYYLADSPDGRPRMCGSPDHRFCPHRLRCVECEMFIDVEKAEAIERRPGLQIVHIPMPIPRDLAVALDAQDEDAQNEADGTRAGARAGISPPEVPGPAYHFNDKAAPRTAPTRCDQLQHHVAALEAELAQKLQKSDMRNVAVRLLRDQIAALQHEVNHIARSDEL